MIFREKKLIKGEKAKGHDTCLFTFFAWFLLLTGCQTTRHGFVNVAGGGKVYYEQRGRGEPVILLHGHSLDRRMWNPQWKALSKNHSVIRLDFRGYGKSSEQSETLQLTHVDDVITLMDSLHIDCAHVIGLSMGAFVAGDMLAMYPERMLSCTLASGGIRNSPGPSTPMNEEEKAKRDKEIVALQQKGIDTFKREWHETLMASGGSQRERMRQPLWQMIDDWSAWQPLHKEVRLFYGKEAWEKLRQRGKTDIPTLIIRGENEAKGKKKQPAEMPYLSHVRYVVIPDCGHMLNMERPEEFNQLVLLFIDTK